MIASTLLRTLATRLLLGVHAIPWTDGRPCAHTDAGGEAQAGAFRGILLGAICCESKTNMRDEDKGLKARAARPGC
jgi:hypothetical protein